MYSVPRGYPAEVSLAVAIPCGIGSAAVYGTSIVFQHRMAQEHSDEGDQASAAGLLRLVRNPMWLLAVGGDVIGFVLQIAALATGPVVVVQPLVVLMLPVALAVSSLLHGHRPRIGDYLGVLAVLGGLGVFLALIGVPAPGHVPRSRVLGSAVIIVFLAGVAACALVTGRRAVVRGAVYGGVAGAFFGAHAVMVDAVFSRLGKGGLHALFGTPRGLVPLAGIVLLGISGIVLTQMSFQVGTLHATLPTNLAFDPFIGVLLGALLLREHFPLSTGHCVVYGFCVLAVVLGAVRLADPTAGPIDPDPPVAG